MNQNNKLLNIIAFSILMENDKGIISKSPSYILEKFNRYCLSTNSDEYGWGLDVDNKRKLLNWVKKWRSDITLNNY